MSFSKKSDKFFHFREEYHACSIVLQLKLACSLYFFFIGFFFNQPAGSDYTHYSEVLKALNCTFSLSRIRIWLILPSTKISTLPWISFCILSNFLQGKWLEAKIIYTWLVGKHFRILIVLNSGAKNWCFCKRKSSPRWNRWYWYLYQRYQ